MSVRLSGGRPRAKEQRLRTRAIGLLSAAMVLGGLLAVSPASVGAAPLSGQPFSAYGPGNTTVANVEAASSGGGVNSAGLNAPLINEFGVNIAPATPGKNALGRGT